MNNVTYCRYELYITRGYFKVSYVTRRFIHNGRVIRIEENLQTLASSLYCFFRLKQCVSFFNCALSIIVIKDLIMNVSFGRSGTFLVKALNHRRVYYPPTSVDLHLLIIHDYTFLMSTRKTRFFSRLATNV